jgi:hydroxymethylpyrimidine pyrophosphatase-like HAD family hydrolase
MSQPARLRAVYCDLDGTLLGQGGSLVHDHEGAFTLLAVRAVEALHRAEAELVLYSGRRRAQVHEDARLLGQTSFIYEIGGGLSVDGEDFLLTGDLQHEDGLTVHDQVTASGAPDLLLATFDLQYHSPWHTQREITHLFRGTADVEQANLLLAERGLGHLRLLDNGASRRGGRVFHLVPRPASKTHAVERHMQIRGLAREEVIGIGDSPEDMATAEAVGAFWLVDELPGPKPDNVRVSEERGNSGVYEAVITELAERRG